MNEVQYYKFQVQASEDIGEALTTERGANVIGIVGCGKTFILGRYLKEQFDKGELSPIPGSMAPPVLYISLKPVVPQTKKVLERYFGLKADRVLCLTYPELRSKGYMSLFFEPETYYEGMEEKVKYNWKPTLFPRLLVVDEPQALRNEGANITQLMMSLYRLSPQTKFINLGYTPFVKPSEAKWCTLTAGTRTVPGSTHPETVLREEAWSRWLHKISGGSPNSLNASAVERVKRAWGKSYVLVKNVRFKHKVRNNQLIIPFATSQHREMYDQAWADYLKELDEAGRMPPGDQALQKAIALLKLQKRAELIRSSYLVHAAAMAQKEGKTPIIAIKYHDTVSLVKVALRQYPELQPSYIIGGQTGAERQDNIDRFQEGKTNFCVITIGAGGTGLSLHHNPDNKDISSPREVYMSPAFNAIDVAQTAGRAHRINSISETNQYLLYFKDTVEEYVASKLEKKLNCMSKLISKNETWGDFFVPQEKMGHGRNRGVDGGQLTSQGEEGLELDSGDFMDHDEKTTTKELSFTPQPQLTESVV